MRDRPWLVGDGVVVLGCGYFDGLRCIPIVCGEGQRRLISRNVCILRHLYCDGYVCGWFSIQHHCVTTAATLIHS